MKNTFLIFIGLLMIILMSSFFNLFCAKPVDPGTKMAHRISKGLVNNFKSKYGLNFSGLGEEGPDGKYKGLSFDMSYPYILTKDQGRALLVACMQEAVQTFNSYPEFQPYMKNYPFTDENITINIFINPQANPDVYYPNIGIFSFYLNKLRYKIDTPQSAKTPNYYSEERETYEEALKILAEQQKNHPPNYSPFPFNNPNSSK